MGEKDAERGRPCLPVATLESPRRGVVPLGFVAVSGAWDVDDFDALTNDLAVRLAARAHGRFPIVAVALFNFKWHPGRGYAGHGWFDGTADVYGEAIYHASRSGG